MIRSTRHHIKDSNSGKKSSYSRFIEEYSRVAKLMVEQVWVKLPDDLNLPKYLDYKTFNIETDLSARALSSAATQVSGIVRASITKQKRRLWVKKNKNALVKDVKFSMPQPNFIAPNISSKCCHIIKKCDGKFWGFIELKYLGDGYETIRIPIIKHPRMLGDYKLGISLFRGRIQMTWEFPDPVKNITGSTLGLDQGYKTVATLSDGQSTPTECPHGHSLESIISKMSRRKKGSRAFHEAQDHRNNFVRWSCHQLNFSNVKELRMEKIQNIRFKKRSSRRMSHWSNPEIRDTIIRTCEQLGVQVVEQSCAYRSQRCNQCGQVRKSNRKAKLYDCKNCGFTCDADLNAAKNHEIDLPDVPRGFLGQKLNLGNGFFWKSTGFSTFDGAEIRVPCSYN